MALLNELIDQIENPDLKNRIASEVEKLAKQKKFGLVFEEHLPECTPLWDIPVKKGAKVALKAGHVSDFYTVLKIENGIATCLNKDKSATAEFDVDDLVSVAEFGEPIYPFLKPLDTVCNAPECDVWHTLIEADNYHALQLLEYLYSGKVDCIYIDPPYNTGARDWKYNNDYVDSTDTYRHSKWLSMMQKRLILAKKLLNPNGSVLIVTIDEKEYLHLGCLLEELFPNTNIQMISSVIAQNASARKGQFSRSNEYIFFISIGNAGVQELPLSDEWRPNADDKRALELRWADLMRCGDNGTRRRSPNCFYPILVSTDGKQFLGAAPPLPADMDRREYNPPAGAIPIWPIHRDGVEGAWGYSYKNLIEIQSKGYVKLGKLNGERMRITYLTSGIQKRVEEGKYNISGYNEDGSIISDTEYRSITAGTVWNIQSHNASRNGTELLKKIIGKRFDYPKSLYAVRDTIRFYLANKPEALIVDFFAGSGTTLHAVNLLNEEDGGSRRCILVTNNEVSDSEAKEMSKLGLQPGDEEWEQYGIARYVTWPRTVCSIEGQDIKGNPLKGNYLDSELPMSAGFKANAAFFKLGFLDKTEVSLGRQFKEMLPTLWMKAGAHGPCPSIGEETPDMLVLLENKFAVLLDEKQYMEFAEKLDEYPEIETVFIVTDSESGYRDMISGLDVKESYQLYRDYLDNFRINAARR